LQRKIRHTFCVQLATLGNLVIRKRDRRGDERRGEVMQEKEDR
jgi:hypothetical protein